MTFQEIKHCIVEQLGETVIVKSDDNAVQPSLTLQTEQLAGVCRFLYEDSRLFFDFLSCITAIDNGPVADSLEVVYHLNSIPYEHTLVLRVFVKRDGSSAVPTVSGIWRTADWHERESYDLVGVRFEGHPDMRRILLPNDWEGHPLRQDYDVQKTYHGIEVKY